MTSVHESMALKQCFCNVKRAIALLHGESAQVPALHVLSSQLSKDGAFQQKVGIKQFFQPENLVRQCAIKSNIDIL